MVNDNSDQILKNKKFEIFVNLFKKLSNGSLITSLSVISGAKKLNEDLKKLIQPIIVELKEENETLNEEEFIKAMEHLYDVMNNFKCV